MARLTLGAWALVAALGTAAPVIAGDPGIEAARAALHKERQSTVAANLSLTEDEGRAFWPVYREYRMELSRTGDRMVKLLTDFGAKYDTLADADATQLLDEYLAIQSSELSIRKKYLKQFRSVLPPKKVARFYQIENKLDAAVRFELSGLVPLVK